MAKEKNASGEMSFLDHLEELRWLLVRSCSAIMICAVIAFTFSREIFDEVIFAPLKSEFITYRLFAKRQTNTTWTRVSV